MVLWCLTCLKKGCVKVGSSPKVRLDTATVSWPAATTDEEEDGGGPAAAGMAISWANGTTMETVDGGRTWHRDPSGVRFIPGNGHGVKNGRTISSVDGAGVPNGYTSCRHELPCAANFHGIGGKRCPSDTPTCLGYAYGKHLGFCYNLSLCDPRSQSPPLSGHFITNYTLAASADPVSRAFKFWVNRTAAGQTSWGPPPHPVVEFSAGSGGMADLGGGRFLATPVVWYSAGALKMPNTGGPCCNNTVVAYLSTDAGRTFHFRSEIANKAQVNARWPSVEGPNEVRDV